MNGNVLEAARYCVEEEKKEECECRECPIRTNGETCETVFARELVDMAETMEKLQDEILDLRDERDRLRARIRIAERQQESAHKTIDTLCRVAGCLMDDMYGERD